MSDDTCGQLGGRSVFDAFGRAAGGLLFYSMLVPTSGPPHRRPIGRRVVITFSHVLKESGRRDVEFRNDW